MEPALRAGLVVEGASPGELRFAHELIRDWLYGELDPSERAELHRREADSLEALADRDPRLLNELAHHRVAAAPVGGAGAAIDACERAARHAVDELAFEDAAALYERGLALAERLLEALEPARHAGLLIALGETRQRAGDSDGAREAFARAANLARASGLPAELAQAALGFGAIVVKPGETDQTLVALLEQSLALVPESSAALRSRLLARLARELHFKADTERPRALAVEAVALAQQSGDPAVQAFALHAWHVAHAAPDTAEARAEVSAGIVELARESGDTELELSGWVLAATDMLELGRPAAAAERLDEAEVLATRLRQPALTWRVLLVRGTLASLAGRFDEAERTIAEAYSVGRRSVGRGAFRYWVLQRHELMCLRGGDERLEADERLLAEEAPDVWGAGLLHLLAITGRGDEARAGFEQLAANDFGGPIDDMAALPVLARCAEICTLLGDTERAELIYERLLPHADRWLGVLGSVFAGTVHARLGGLATTMGHKRAGGRTPGGGGRGTSRGGGRADHRARGGRPRRRAEDPRRQPARRRAPRSRAAHRASAGNEAARRAPRGRTASGCAGPAGRRPPRARGRVLAGRLRRHTRSACATARASATSRACSNARTSRSPPSSSRAVRRPRPRETPARCSTTRPSAPTAGASTSCARRSRRPRAGTTPSAPSARPASSIS